MTVLTGDIVLTNCCCCGRPLTDATSAEIGIGPTCRVRYGYDHIPEAPDIEAAKMIIEKLDGITENDVVVLKSHLSGNIKELANLITRHVSVRGFCTETIGLLELLSIIGYRLLSEHLKNRHFELWINYENDKELTLKAPYDEQFVQLNRERKIGGKWDGSLKRWRYNRNGETRSKLFATVKECFPGRCLVIPAGFVIL